MNAEMKAELEDFADKASGDRKTRVASCLVCSDGSKIFGTNRLRDDNDLTDQEISDRTKPRFYDAMKCGEADIIDKALQLGLDLTGSKLYSLLFPCPRCADKIANTNIKHVYSMRHRTKHNGKFDNSFEDSVKTLNKTNIKYDAGEADDR